MSGNDDIEYIFKVVLQEVNSVKQVSAIINGITFAYLVTNFGNIMKTVQVQAVHIKALHDVAK